MRNPCKHPKNKTRVIGFKMDRTIRVVWCQLCGSIRRDTKIDPRIGSGPLNWEPGKWSPPALIRDQQSTIFELFIRKAERQISQYLYGGIVKPTWMVRDY